MTKIENYQQKIQILLDLFNQQDAHWMSKRTWIKAMLNFDLGEDFFITFFLQKDTQINDFQNAVIFPWVDNLVNEKNPQDDDERLEVTSDAVGQTYLLGTELHPKFLAVSREIAREEQVFLDYAWWILIKDLVYPTVSKRYQQQLDKKAALFLECIKN
ncbi:MAG: hypothetical protein WCL02_09105 [bacterium]